MKRKKAGAGIPAKLNQKAGYAIVFALVAILVITLACMSIFAAASSAVKNAVSEQDRQQAKILAESLANDVIAAEIDAVYDKAPQNDGEPVYEDDSLAAYLYSNIAMNTADPQGSWTWYNDDEAFRSKKNASRSFPLSGDALADKNISGEITMYWESTGEDETNKDYGNRKLYIEVTVNYAGRGGTESATVTTVYECLSRDNEQYFWKKEK